MTERVLPGIGLNGFWDQGAPWKVGGDQNWLKSSVLTQLAVESMTTPLPVSPSNGVIYIVPAAGIPANQIAARDNGAWVYFPPFKGMTAYVRDANGGAGGLMNFDGTAWIPSTTPLSTALGANNGSAIVGFKRNAIASTVPVDLYNWFNTTPIRDVECGVVGNNIADDTAALNVLTAVGRATGQRVVGRVGATYKISDTVHVNCNFDFSGSTFSAPASLAVPAIKSSGTVAGSQLIFLSIKYPTVVNGRADGVVPTAGGIGIQLEGIRDCSLQFASINGFEENLQLYSNNGANGFVAYNTLYFSELIWRSKINIHFKTELTGWVNQCVFIGGQFARITGDTFPTVNVQITKADTGGNNPPNGHTFFGCSMEGNFTTTIKYNLNPAIVTSYASCNSWINCRMENAASMEFSPLALSDLFLNCLGAYTATFVGGVLPTIIGGFRLFQYTMDIAAIVGSAGFRTAVNAAMFQAGNSGNALAIAFGQSGRINAGVTAGGAFITLHPTDPTRTFATTSVNTTGGIPKLEGGDGSAAAGNYIGWFGLNDWRIAGSFAPVTDVTYNLGSAARRFTNVYASNFRPGAGTATWTGGAGTPEGAVIGTVGSMYTRTDGGAATTLYVKESGSGNTGWVAK